MGEEIPSPGRLFQALVAASALGRELDPGFRASLEWLEGRPHPLIGLPHMHPGQRMQIFVPDNDIDSKEGDPQRLAEIRSAKTIAPRFFAEETPFLFVWDFAEQDLSNAQVVCSLSERLYQFGRGVDMAWAKGEILDAVGVEARLSAYEGKVYKPASGNSRPSVPCPLPGTLQSLMTRHALFTSRFQAHGSGKDSILAFSQPPKPRFTQVSYGSPPDRCLFELRPILPGDSFAVWPLALSSRLVTQIRDLAAQHLREALPEFGPSIEQALIGRKADGRDDGPIIDRIRIVPLASIGHTHADRHIRRVLIEIPGDCPLRSKDVHWAFSGLQITCPSNNGKSGELGINLVPARDQGMLFHYIPAEPGERVWRTVTPTALPVARRRIEPTRMAVEAKNGRERAEEELKATGSVLQALRHAGVRSRVAQIKAQREPFDRNGARAESFASGTRFPKERLWHLEITFVEPVSGPLVIGDGRFLGLGVMAPLPKVQGVRAFEIKAGLSEGAQTIDLVRALRRAVLARAQGVLGPSKTLPPFFSGHDLDGTPARSEQHPHLAFAFGPHRSRLLVIPPHILDRREPTTVERRYLRLMDQALADFRELRAGSAGLLILEAVHLAPNTDLLLATSQTWQSATPYQVTRHRKHVPAFEVLAEDIRNECHRRGLPLPNVTVQSCRGVSGEGLEGWVQLTFSVAVPGPLLLGRGRHIGLGLFSPTRDGVDLA